MKKRKAHRFSLNAQRDTDLQIGQVRGAGSKEFIPKTSHWGPELRPSLQQLFRNKSAVRKEAKPNQPR